MGDSWNIIIRPRRRWWDIDIKGIIEYKYLLYLFVKRDFNVVFKQTILGPLWYIVQPLFTSGIFTMIFGAIAKLPTDGIPQPLFYFAGVSLWSYFATLLTQSSMIFQTNSGLFGKVYFPRLVVPLAISASKFLTYSIQLGFLAIIYIAYLIQGANVHLTWLLLTLPLVYCLTVMLALGLGLWVAAWSVKYRDLTNLVGFGVGLLMYATPIIYPLSMVPEKWKLLIYLNPMSGIVEWYRFSLFGQGTLDFGVFMISAGMTTVIFIIGLLLFSRAEQTAMDVV